MLIIGTYFSLERGKKGYCKAGLEGFEPSANRLRADCSILAELQAQNNKEDSPR